MSEDDQRATIKDFLDAVNMQPHELLQWLETAESRSVGQKTAEGDESVGHRSGRRIVRLLSKRSNYTAADTQHMRKVVGYVRRHLAQRPQGDVQATRWRYSLMNWGHDPLKN